MNKWQVYISNQDNLRRFVKMFIGRTVGDGQDEYVTPSGVIHRVSEAVQPDDELAWIVPTDVLIPLHAALSEHIGNGIPSVGELKVLREWLDSERTRVDKLIYA